MKLFNLLGAKAALLLLAFMFTLSSCNQDEAIIEPTPLPVADVVDSGTPVTEQFSPQDLAAQAAAFFINNGFFNVLWNHIRLNHAPSSRVPNKGRFGMANYQPLVQRAIVDAIDAVSTAQGSTGVVRLIRSAQVQGTRLVVEASLHAGVIGTNRFGQNSQVLRFVIEAATGLVITAFPV